MRFQDFYSTMEKHHFFVFSFRDLLLLYPKENAESLKTALYRWRKQGWIGALKRGIFELTYPRKHVIPDLYISNRLYVPSYVSLETALSIYSLIPEIAHAVTSVTTKPTRRFKNPYGLFTYRTIQPSAFCGYEIKSEGGFDYLIACPEKALIDFLYFKAHQHRGWNYKEQRWNTPILSQLSRKKLRKYSRLFPIKSEWLDAFL